MALASTTPGVTFEAMRSSREASALRTDVAAFIGRTRRGPVGVPVRVDGWRAYERIFGPVWQGAHTPYAVKAYFENGARAGYVHRLGNGATASSRWIVRADPGEFAPMDLAASSYWIKAATPGKWGNEVDVRITCRRNASNGWSVDIKVIVSGENGERLNGLPIVGLAEEVNRRSRFITLTEELPVPPVAAVAGPGPASIIWRVIQLAGGTEGAATAPDDYRVALTRYMKEPEPAMLAMPDLHLDISDPALRHGVLQGAARLSAESMDRIVIADLPQDIESGADAALWLEGFGNDPAIHRAAAAYHPWLAMIDPLGTALKPQRIVPPCGHVAGAFARLDLECGAAFTPANITLNDAVDLADQLSGADQASFNDMGINVLKCHAGRGLMIWGGRMVKSDNVPTRFVAHRRLIHRLVRAVRRVSEPLVFEGNDVNLWLALSRAATTLLLEAFRAGTLKGKLPEEAFRVRCDAELNSQAVRDQGKVICEIAIAPASPMEFITLRVALSADGSVEVAEP